MQIHELPHLPFPGAPRARAAGLILSALRNSLALLAAAICAVISAAAQNNIGWTLVWADEFAQPNGSSPDASKWAYELGAGGWGNNELEHYTSRTNNVRIENGQLVIEARQESYQGSSYTSARLKTQGRISWTYGRIEARLKIPRTQGIWPAFWTLGTNISAVNWPNCGEIDIMENIGKEPTLVHGTLHGPGYSGGSSIGVGYSLPGNAPFADDFHVYAVEWTTNQLKWFVDGVQYFSANPASLPAGKAWVFTQPQFVLLNVAVGGNWPGNPDGTTAFPQRMVVDYLRVYAPTNLPSCNPGLLANAGFESGSLTNWTTYGGGANTAVGKIANLPVHDGTNVFKLYGQFNGSENYSGILQDVAVAPGQSFNASGWALTPRGDAIAGANTAWVEVRFRDSVGNTLGLFRSSTVSTNTPVGGWLQLAVTTQLNPTTFAQIGVVSNLVAPAGTVSARMQLVFRQLQNAAGAVLFDDLKFAATDPAEIVVPVAVGRSGTNLSLSFPTFLGHSYQLGYKQSLAESEWLPLTGVLGDGRIQTVSDSLGFASRFYQVRRLCP